MSSIDIQEIENFSKDAARWWDEDGPFKPLHRLNPVRLSYIKAQICAHFGRDEKDLNALKTLKILDIGCGGGLVCEPLARMGATVTGVDADPVAIEVAKEHGEGLHIDYFNTTAEDLSKKFDVVLALEILEHVASPQDFVASVSKLVKPGGMAIFSTLNRNPKSFLLGIVAAEYLLRWVPRGTHRWKKFIRPSELARMARPAGFEPYDITGLVFDPLSQTFRLSKPDPDVNYLLTCKKG